ERANRSRRRDLRQGGAPSGNGERARVPLVARRVRMVVVALKTKPGPLPWGPGPAPFASPPIRALSRRELYRPVFRCQSWQQALATKFRSSGQNWGESDFISPVAPASSSFLSLAAPSSSPLLS